jgi:FkbM family methyltransferase
MRLGTSYGGWWVPRDINELPQPRVLVSAGLGFDTSFDEEMLRRKFFVVGLDPLQECCQRALTVLGPHSQLTIYKLGISTFSGYETFYQPKNPLHDSWSTINAQEVVNPTAQDFAVISLEELWSSNPQIKDARFRYLKMDIEGAELSILENSLPQVAKYDFVAIEMDFLSLVPFFEVKKRIVRTAQARVILAELEALGFDLIQVDNFNFFWSRQRR